MAKPIFIIRIPDYPDTIEKLLSYIEKINLKLNDYHVLYFADNKVKEIKFECFNPKNCSNKDIEEIKKFVNSKLNK